MGLSRAAVAWLMEEHKRRPIEGTVLTLGVQNVFLTQPEFEALANRMDVTLIPSPKETRTALVDGTITADHVFRRLGADRVVATDLDDFEGCDFVFDLNASEIPEAHRGMYELVLDAGTMEHVFHVPNGFANLSAFVAPGGRIVHQSPSSNHIDHGFWMFSPTLFWDYYTANGYDLPRFDLFRYRFSVDQHARWVFAEYRPNSLSKQMFGGLGGGCFGISLVAEKTHRVGVQVIPQQGMYATAWANSAPPGLGSTVKPSPLRRHWKSLVGAFQNLFPEEWRVRWRAASRRFPLPVRQRF